jgi:hypothetical protein
MTRVPARAADLVGAFLARAGRLTCLLAVSALLVPATALAGVAPTVDTGQEIHGATVTTVDPQATTSSQELVFGWINPRGLSTSYSVDYAVSTDLWCTSGGHSGSPQTTGTASVGFTDSNPHNLSLAVSGLTSGTTYCAALAATNSAGTTVGNQVPFTAGVPTVTTTTATATGVQHASIQGTVDPATQATTYSVVYDLATSTWCTSNGLSGSPSYSTSPATSLPQQDAVAHNVTFNISDQTASVPLQSNTEYCAAIAANNGSSTIAGVQVIGTTTVATFTTDQAVKSTSIQSISATTAQLAGFVNPDGASTTYFAAYAPVSSDWCQTNGTGGSPSNTTTPQPLNAQDESAHNVTVNIPGLTTGESYCVSLESDNTPMGVSFGGELPDQTLSPLPPPFTAGLPTATTFDVNPDSPTTAQLNGSVGPSGQATTYYAVYDQQNSAWCESDGTTGTPSDSSTPVGLAQSDSGTYDVSVEMTGLTPGAQYCVALAAHNGSNGQSGSPSPTIGGTAGYDIPEDFTAGIAPGASGSDIVDQTASASVVSGTANAEGQTTTYQVAYDTAGSRWCNGEAGSPAGTTTGATLPSAATSDQPVSVSLTGLTSGTTYCEAILATNQSGSTTGPQALFVAGLPTAAVSSATTSSDTSETVVGAVIPTTQATSYYVAYDAASAAWCASGGGDPSGATYATGHLELGAIDNVVHAVSVTLTGLAPGENYCAEFVAVNDSQAGIYTGTSGQLAFTAGYPFTATTTRFEGVTDTSATIDGTVNPAGLATSYWAAYDLSGSRWCSSQGHSGQPSYSSTPISLPQADRLTHSVSAAVSGLLPGTSYCAAVYADNDDGTIAGTQVSFTTVSDGSAVTPTATPGPTPVPPTADPPSQVAVRTVSMTSPREVGILASINPGGQTTTYHVAYAPASSSFCVGGGTGGGSSTTATQTLTATDSSTHQVTVQIAGLAAGTRYCAKVVAENASGTTDSVIKVFTTISDPRLSDLRLSPKKFVTHAPANAILRPGTRVSFRDSQAGRVAFVVTTHRHRRTVVIGRFSRTTRGGPVSFTFSGKVAGKPLPRGQYELEATATNRWGLASAHATVGFKVL